MRWLGAVPPALMVVICISNCPPSVSVSSSADFSHSINTKVSTHELNDGTINIHTLSRGLSDNMTLINDFVSSKNHSRALYG